jgi:hypothetical protein
MSEARVRLCEEREFYSMLAGNLGKIDSIVEIARSEADALGDELRMVVLADYVRAADLPKRSDEPFRPMKLGVIPIFEALRRSEIAGVKIGVLTGTLVILPAATVGHLQQRADELGIPADHLRASALTHDPEFVRFEISGESGHRIVELVTTLFNNGEVNLLVGTQSLLGEGWDAPTVNTLVLASYVGSYMLSNQMRGRAIRTDPLRPHKAANIWHLATIVPDNADEGFLGLMTGGVPARAPVYGFLLGPDMQLLVRRFQAFEGIGQADQTLIQNGIERLSLLGWQWHRMGIQQVNEAMLERARNRAQLGSRWQTALAGNSERPEMRRVTRVTHTPRLVAFSDTLQYLAITGVLGGLFSAANSLRGRMLSMGFSTFLILLFAVGFLYALPKLAKSLYLLIRNGSLEGSLAQVAQAIVEALDNAGRLSVHGDYIAVSTTRTVLGKVLLRVEGGSRSDERLILSAIADVLGPVENPRYLLVRHSFIRIWRRVDYHAVPICLSTKDHAEYLHARWNARVGEARLVYGRTAKGRRVLLRARTRSMAAGFQREVDRLSVWE